MANRAEEVLSAVLRDLVGFNGTITPTLKQEEVSGWDSMAHIAIVEELESRFNVRFTTDEMITMTSLPRIREGLAKRGVADV
jgi:acyl carrier protein